MGKESIESKFTNTKRFATSLREVLERIFTLDLRALACTRIAIGLIVISDWINRLVNFQAFFTESGLFPQTLVRNAASPLSWSLYYLSPRSEWAAILMGIEVIFGAALLAGFRTQLATFCCWIFVLSAHTRIQPTIQSGDVLLQLLLLLGCFLPWGERLSLDSTRRKSKISDKIFSVATIAWSLQVMSVYFVGVVLKNHPIWTKDGSAVYYALNIDHFVTPLGKMVLQAPLPFLRFLCFSVLLWEFFGPVLLLMPWHQNWLRPLTVAGFWAMHWGFGATLSIGNFVWISMASTLPFLPAHFWNQLTRRSSAWAPSESPIRSRLPIVASVFLTILIVLNLGMNFAAVFRTPALLAWKPVSTLSLLLHDDQPWSMFAPFPMTDDGWFIIPALLKNGKQVDVFRGGAPVSHVKPAVVAWTYSDFRWRKFMVNLWSEPYSGYRPELGRYLCAQWNQNHVGEEQATSLEIVYMREDTPPPGEPIPPAIPVTIFRGSCSI